MFVENLERDFYKLIRDDRCLLLVNFDVDAICACRILQQLFKNDNMIYTLVPVQGIQDMVHAFEENCEEIKNVILINCGGTLDLVELLQPAESVIFYVIDNHRPYDLCNIYSEHQVRILGKPDEDDEIPEYNEVFRDDSSDEDEDEDLENEESQAKRRRLNEEDIVKRAERRKWTENRATILFNYTQYSYYGKSSAMLVFDMAWNMSKDSLDMLWWAIVGFTEQAILGKVETRSSVLEEGALHSHVSRLTHRQGGEVEKQQQSTIRITYDKDLSLVLYRHWTVEASLRHSVPTAVSLRLWSIRGEQRLKELLAEMGLPLEQSRQRFNAMDLALRHEFRQMIEKLAGKYKVDSIIGTSFTLQYGYRFKYCASDIVYAMLALMESSTKEKLPQRCFLDALDCLSRTKKDVLEGGIEKAKLMLSSVFKTAQGVLQMKQIRSAGSFLYIIIPEGSVDSHVFARTYPLLMLAQFTLKAYVNSSKNRRAREWPLVVSSICNAETGTCLVVGIPPECEDQPRSLFGRAFEQAAKNTNSYIEADYFDTTIIRLKTEERPKFLDSLAALLA
ncbi:PREDICTED: cell division control protein 45 homolog [Dufourea novaeangliae]|uniref:Cell division control protein 45 like protein n=1 Tax=Dufourea novaeangliae TaxID=178035 RepID=A0A154PU39_DUFNO|nr:PREDICTED: cell division control protein 45 homolog [Dufourea novaeangliae]KZC14878.1 Cell division control protein 45 like protein [Dufourea novaeangliae]